MKPIQIKENQPFLLNNKPYYYQINAEGKVVIKTGAPVKSTGFTPPSLSEVKAYFAEKGYKEESAIKFYDYYSVANWHDQSGKPIKNWKQKAIVIWFKPENKMPPPRNNDNPTEPKFVM